MTEQNMVLVDYQPDFIDVSVNRNVEDILQRMKLVGEAMIMQNVDRHVYNWPNHCCR